MFGASKQDICVESSFCPCFLFSGPHVTGNVGCETHHRMGAVSSQENGVFLIVSNQKRGFDVHVLQVDWITEEDPGIL